jgi:acetyltransferase
MVLAQELISRTRVAKLLAGYRNRPAADIDAICHTLIQISHLVTDLSEIIELDINPLLADSRGVIALDARIRVKEVDKCATGIDRLAIRPYPEELEEAINWQGRPVILRPIKPEDGQAHIEFFNALDPEDVRFRMFIRMRELQPSQLARLTQIDYDREMAFIATGKNAEGRWETLGVARVIADPDNNQAEFAVIVRSDLKKQGLGRILMTKLIAYCRARGTREIVGEALSQNIGVLNLCAKLGFDVRPSNEDMGTMRLTLHLQPAE